MASSFDTYYIDAESFNNATTIYTDSALTTTAPDGIYQFNGIHRTLTGGVLGSIYYCDTCCAGCSSTYIYPVPPAKNTAHNVCSNIGVSTNTAIVIKVKFTSPSTQLLGYPIGIRAIFNGQFYQGVTSNRFGYLPEVFVGSSDVVSPSDLEASSPYALDGYAWQPLTSTFVQTQNTPTFITQSMVNSTPNNPDECYLLIPKTVQESTVEPQIMSPTLPIDQASAGCDITIPCPTALNGIGMSTVVASVADTCAESLPDKNFIMRVNSTSGPAKMFDRVFADPAGVTAIADGYYKMDNITGSASGSSWMHISGGNGVVKAVGVCASGGQPALTQMIGSEVRSLEILACQYQNSQGTNLPDQIYWHDGANDAPDVADNVYSDITGTTPLADGWYQLMREYMVIEVSGGLGEVTTISSC